MCCRLKSHAKRPCWLVEFTVRSVFNVFYGFSSTRKGFWRFSRFCLSLIRTFETSKAIKAAKPTKISSLGSKTLLQRLSDYGPSKPWPVLAVLGRFCYRIESFWLINRKIRKVCFRFQKSCEIFKNLNWDDLKTKINCKVIESNQTPWYFNCFRL